MAATRRHPDRDHDALPGAEVEHHRGGRRGQAAPSLGPNAGRNVAILAPVGRLAEPEGLVREARRHYLRRLVARRRDLAAHPGRRLVPPRAGPRWAGRDPR